jgi:predicted CXXCH cytochrome family protein
MQKVVIKAGVITVAAMLAVAGFVFAVRPAYRGTRAGFADEDYLSSRNCLSCHENHFASWARTHHRRMTQEATAATVQGDFTRENTFDYLGVRAQMTRQAGRFVMALALPDGKQQTYEIARTVGSRRIEQYLAKQNDQYVRLPLAYDLVNRRWMSLNGSFFYPDSENYFQHQAQWDANCVFCHNVKAQPHFNQQTRQFATEVTELGIACGACHGQSATHAEAASSPLTRVLWRWRKNENKHIVNPTKLTAERSLMVCGHCHGQRVPAPMERIQEILGKGDPFNAGDDLHKFYQPVGRETKIGEFSFAQRFWNNGAPRLTAYEYQGIRRSQCFAQGSGEQRMTCLTCHSMHAGDIKGQLKPENRTNTPCLSCHQQFTTEAALATHTKHAPSSVGSRCYNCHMPRVVYGVMSFHPTHEITVPDATLTAVQGVPNACNQCHLDKSVNWTIAQSKTWWPQRFANAQPSNHAAFDQAEGMRALFAGDALTRALAAEALGGGGPMAAQAWATPYLLEAFNDNYPIVRFFIGQALMRQPTNLPRLDYLGTTEARQRAAESWWQTTPPDQRAAIVALANQLRALRINSDLDVGE